MGNGQSDDCHIENDTRIVKRQSFFGYFPVSPLARQWDIYATSFGFVPMDKTAASYPPDHHPADHQFSWDSGRVLHDHQILHIHAGRGEFESAVTARVAFEAGDTTVLFPGIWHRYRPVPGTGWTESWMELRGTQMERLQQNGTLDPRTPVSRHPLSPAGEQAWERAYETARNKPAGFTVHLGLIGLEILLRLGEKPTATPTPSPIERAVSQAQTLLSSDLSNATTVEDLARRLGVGYSHFRRAFLKQTGFSPKQYENEIRHRRVKALLAETSMSIKEIADRLGFSSPYHLTKDFSQRAALAPSHWRGRQKFRDPYDNRPTHKGPPQSR